MSRGTLDPAGLPQTSDTGLSPSMAGCSKAVLLSLADPTMQSEPRNARIPVWALPLSLAATHGIDVSFSSSAYLDVSVQRVPFVHLWIQCTMTEVPSAGFPHSDIGGSPDICSSPPLFAAYHVFLRLSVPRHPPCALSCLTSHYTVAFLVFRPSVMWSFERACISAVVLSLSSYDDLSFFEYLFYSDVLLIINGYL